MNAGNNKNSELFNTNPYESPSALEFAPRLHDRQFQKRQSLAVVGFVMASVAGLVAWTSVIMMVNVGLFDGVPLIFGVRPFSLVGCLAGIGLFVSVLGLLICFWFGNWAYRIGGAIVFLILLPLYAQVLFG